MNNNYTCLFTGEKLNDSTKEEHTILRSLGGRIRSKRVTSSSFNQKASKFDKFFSEQYSLIVNVLSPVLPKEFSVGQIPIKDENGNPLVFEQGITKLSEVKVIKRYPSGKPEQILMPPNNLKKIIKKFNIDEKNIKIDVLPGKINHFDIQLVSIQAHIAMLKCILCSFDEICQANYSDFNFIRDKNLSKIRSFIKEAIMEDKYKTAEILKEFYLGIQLKADKYISRSLKYFKYQRKKYEHIIFVTTNTATKTIDVIWDFLGIEVHAMRLTTNWQGQSFCGIIVNPILKDSQVFSQINLDDEIPFLEIECSIYKAFGPIDKEEIFYSIIKQRLQGYNNACLYIENYVFDFHKKNIIDAIKNKKEDLTIATFMQRRLERIFQNSYSKEELCKKLLQFEWIFNFWQISLDKIQEYSDEEFCAFWQEYLKIFNALYDEWHPAGYVFPKSVGFYQVH